MKLFGNKHEKNNRGHEEKKPKKRGSILAVVLGSVLGVLVLTVAAYTIWESPPERSGEGLSRPDVSSAPVPTNTPDSSKTQTPTPKPTETPVSPHNDNIYNILVAGKDKVGSNTDTILIASLNTEKHVVNVISIPRDTLVNIPSSVKKVNTLYGMGLNKDGDGGASFMDGMEDMLGFRLDGYAVVNLKAVEEIIDQMGGVYFDVPVDMYYEAEDQGLSIAIPKGYQWLDGENAVKVLRFRSGYVNADIGRIDTQQAFLKTAASQMLKLGNIPNLTKIVDIIVNNVDTDLTAANISFFAREFLSCSMDDINFMTMPGNYNDSVKGFSYVTVDIDAWIDLINEYINPWNEEVSEENLNILTRKNGALYSTTGTISGGENSFLDYQEYLNSLRNGQ